jgi:hypothetical protein
MGDNCEDIGSPIILGRCPSLSEHESESMLRNLSRLQRETSKRHVGEAHSVLITAILLATLLGPSSHLRKQTEPAVET